MDPEKKNQNTPIEQESFAAYRQRLQDEREAGRAPRRTWLVVVGVLFALLYLVVGVAMLFNWFQWTPSWDLPRKVVGVALIVYGAYRSWRVIKGRDVYGG